MIRNELYRKITHVHTHLLKLGSFEFYSPASEKALESFRGYTRFLIDNFDELEEPSLRPLFAYFTIHIIPFLRFIQRSSTQNIPWSLIPALEKTLKLEKGENCLLLIRPQWHFNYTVFTDDLNHWLSSHLKDLFPVKKDEIDRVFGKNKIHIFSFPYLERTNVLLHSVIGHELGHFHHNEWKESQDGKELLEKAAKELTKYYKQKFQDDLFLPYEKTEIGIKVLQGMYREIICDIVGYYIFGPSTIFVLNYLLNYEKGVALPSEENNYYPPTKYRLRILVENCLESDHEVQKLLSEPSDAAKYFQKYRAEIISFLSDKNDVIALREEYEKELGFFETSVVDLINFALEKIKKKYFSSANVTVLFEKLQDQLPINEIDDEPVNVVNILFTGWIYYYKILKEFKKAEFIENYQLLIRMMLKSVYAAHIHEEFKLNKSEIKDQP